MRKIKLLTDSTCDLSRDLLEKHNITVLPLYVYFGDEEYADGVDLTTADMYRKVSEKGILPKSSAIPPGVFFSCFTKLLEEDYDIIYMGIGSSFSGTFNSAHIAKNMCDSKHIHLIDSENLSSGTGLLLLKAAAFRSQGYPAEEIAEKIIELVPKVRSQFVIDTLDYLYKGGRLNALSAICGKVLHLHPIIKVRNGVMEVGKKVRGSMKKAVMVMLSEAEEIKEEIDTEFFMITHSLATDTFTLLQDEVKTRFNMQNIYETEAGCVISTHCGEGTIGILYIEK